MAEQLKEFFDKRRVERIADQLAAAWPAFPRAQFVRDASKGLDGLELLDRGRHIAAAMARALPSAYPEAIAIVVRSLGPPLEASEGNAMEPFHYLPHVVYVAERGLDNHALSMDAQHAITQRFSCEFSIRPYLDREEARTLAVLRKWTKDPSEHVRRLVSEGTRPRLPWAPRLRNFQKDPSPVLALLEPLKDDESEYVRRSVANNLNDISKDHPAATIATCERWLVDASEERRRLVAHALRTLVRAGHPDAIRLAGGGGDAGAIATKGEITPRVARIGDSIQVEVELRNDAKKAANAVLSIRVHFVKARGDTSAKSFKLPTVALEPGATASVKKTISLRQHTTRTHHPGEHVVELVVNGEPRPLGRFDLRA